MGYGTSLGTAHEDEMSYVLEKGLTDKSEKQRSDTTEINQNSRSGDFQSRFYATDASTMPLEASRKLTDALKSYGSTEIPVEGPKPNSDVIYPTPDYLNPPESTMSFRPRLSSMVTSAVHAVALPGDVLSGKVQPGSVQEIERAFELAGLMVGGPAPVAAKLADGTLGSFAGVKSRTLPKDKLYEAQNMELDMMHPDDIWNKTGFFRGADSRWRYEIPDVNAKLKPGAFDTISEPISASKWKEGTNPWTTIDTSTPQGGKIVPKSTPVRPQEFSSHEQFIQYLTGKKKEPLTLDKVIDHPELFKAYPELGTMKVEPLPDWAKGNKGMVVGDTIYLASGHPEYVRSVLLHEIQHGIQHHEGFAYGGSTEQFIPKELPQAEKEFFQVRQTAEKDLQDRKIPTVAVKEVLRDEARGIDMSKDLEFLKKRFNMNDRDIQQLRNIVKSEELIRQARGEAFTKYQRLMGEVESRNVQARAHYDWRASQIMHPSRTEDIPRHLQINSK